MFLSAYRIRLAKSSARRESDLRNRSDFLLAKSESEGISPAHIVFYNAGLHPVNGVIQLLCNGADLAVSNLHILAADAEPADRGDDGGGAGSEDIGKGDRTALQGA